MLAYLDYLGQVVAKIADDERYSEAMLRDMVGS